MSARRGRPQETKGVFHPQRVNHDGMHVFWYMYHRLSTNVYVLFLRTDPSLAITRVWLLYSASLCEESVRKKQLPSDDHGPMETDTVLCEEEKHEK